MELITYGDIDNGNATLAKFMGWFQKEADKNSFVWYEKGESAIYVAYDMRLTPYRNLPFNRDWNYLMKVVEKIETIRSNGNDGLRIIRHQAIFNDGKTVNFLEDTKISAVWNACVMLAEKYNNDKTF